MGAVDASGSIRRLHLFTDRHSNCRGYFKLLLRGKSEAQRDEKLVGTWQQTMNFGNERQSLETRLVGAARIYLVRMLPVLIVIIWNLVLLAILTKILEKLGNLRLPHRVDTIVTSVTIFTYLVGSIGAILFLARPAQVTNLSLQIGQRLPLLRLSLILFLRKALAYLNRALISLVTVVLAVFLSWRLSATPPSAGDFRMFAMAAGAMLGTILALLLSLSIIPVQRAMETFTSSIGKLYRDDPPSQIVIMTIAVFVLLSFALGLVGPDLGISLVWFASLQLVMIGASLDLMRWHFARVTQLLDPREAISRLRVRIIRYIDGLQAEMSRVALAQWRALSPQQREQYQPRQIESRLYLHLPKHLVNITATSNDLAETALRAVARDETQSAEFAIEALAEVASRYVEKRKHNFLVYPSTKVLLALETDLDQILNPVYEHFLKINRIAVSKAAEAVSIAIVSALGRIGVIVVAVSSRNAPVGSTPLGFAPIHYLGEIVSTAQRRALHDVALSGSRALLEITRSVPENADASIFHHASNQWYEIALQFLLAGKAELVNETVQDTMTLAHHLLVKRYYQLDQVLRQLLDKVEALAPGAVALEGSLGRHGLNVPLSTTYDLTKPQSIGHLISRAASMIEQAEKAWMNPYDEFIDLNEVVTRHFNTLGEKVDFAGSFLLWHITETIKFIARLFLQLAKEPITDNSRHVDDLLAQVPWYMAFFWRSFATVSRPDRAGAEWICDGLATIGIEFYDGGFKRVSEAAANGIASIVRSYCKVAGPKANWYEIADLLIYLWHIRLLAQFRGDNDFANKIDQEIEQAKSLPDDLWARVLEVLELRKRQLSERLEQESYALPTDDATSVLRRLLSSSS